MLAGDPNSQYKQILDTWIDADGEPAGELRIHYQPVGKLKSKVRGDLAVVFVD